MNEGTLMGSRYYCQGKNSRGYACGHYAVIGSKFCRYHKPKDEAPVNPLSANFSVDGLTHLVGQLKAAGWKEGETINAFWIHKITTEAALQPKADLAYDDFRIERETKAALDTLACWLFNAANRARVREEMAREPYVAEQAGHVVRLLTLLLEEYHA